MLRNCIWILQTLLLEGAVSRIFRAGGADDHHEALSQGKSPGPGLPHSRGLGVRVFAPLAKPAEPDGD